MMELVIGVENYSFKYSYGREALSKVKFSVKRGECFGIIGANDAGKTTLFLSLVGILRGSGLIEIGGAILSKKTLRDIRKKIGFLF